MIGVGIIPLVISLALLAVVFFAHFRISRRMGFGTGMSVVIGLTGFLGLPVILWWCMDWPIEAGAGPQDEEVFR